MAFHDDDINLDEQWFRYKCVGKNRVEVELIGETQLLGYMLQEDLLANDPTVLNAGSAQQYEDVDIVAISMRLTDSAFRKCAERAPAHSNEDKIQYLVVLQTLMDSHARLLKTVDALGNAFNKAEEELTQTTTKVVQHDPERPYEEDDRLAEAAALASINPPASSALLKLQRRAVASARKRGAHQLADVLASLETPPPSESQVATSALPLSPHDSPSQHSSRPHPVTSASSSSSSSSSISIQSRGDEKTKKKNEKEESKEEKKEDEDKEEEEEEKKEEEEEQQMKRNLNDDDEVNHTQEPRKKKKRHRNISTIKQKKQ